MLTRFSQKICPIWFELDISLCSLVRLIVVVTHTLESLQLSSHQNILQAWCVRAQITSVRVPRNTKQTESLRIPSWFIPNSTLKHSSFHFWLRLVLRCLVNSEIFYNNFTFVYCCSQFLIFIVLYAWLSNWFYTVHNYRVTLKSELPMKQGG